MKNLFTFLALFFSVTFNISAQQWIDQVYEVDTIKDVYYGSAINFNNNSVDLYLDIYSPKCQDTTTKRPLMMVIHGGGFTAGSKDLVQNNCAEFARRGYVAVSVQYRLGIINQSSLNVCNGFPDFPCLFASDTMELARAYYRGIQDVKGATRYMINRKDVYHIDENNVFLMGESAGAFIAMGVAYMDDTSEKPAGASALSSVNPPNQNTLSCPHNIGETFSGPIPRPDLGGIDGTIEPALFPYTIRGVGNIFGGMFNNLLAIDNATNKPALYSFHRACDIIVPWDSKKVYWGFSICLAQCWGTLGNTCSYIYNLPIVHGSKTIAEWNTNQTLGYDIQSEFVPTPIFPTTSPGPCFGTASCAEQLNNPCHAYDNKPMRLLQMATFFATKIVNPETCVPFNSLISFDKNVLSVFPNPVEDLLSVESDIQINQLIIFDLQGNIVKKMDVNALAFKTELKGLSTGLYLLECIFDSGEKQQTLIRK